MSGTICEKFLAACNREDKKPAIQYPRKGRWLDVSWRNYFEYVERTAAGLHSRGVGHGDRVAIVSSTRPEWAYADMAILGLGAITVPVYQNNTADDVSFILQDSQAKAVFVENAALLARLRPTLAACPFVQTVILFEGTKKKSEMDEVLTLQALQELGEKVVLKQADFFRDTAKQVDDDDVATILYTSGTTGRPKGVVITHTQVMSEVTDTFPLLGVTPKDIQLTFLPYAHILGRIEIWGHVLIGHTMAYAESIERLKDSLTVIHPTIMIAVPRVFEKIYNGILAQAEIGSIRRKIFDWSMSVGREMSRYKVEKQPVPIDLALKYQVARRLVFDSFTEKMGGELRFAICGGAPLSREIAEFFHAAGLLILEGYGLTETTAAICVNTPFDYRFGTVGKPVGEVKIRVAEDGEILVKSKKVMREYYHDPDSTARTLVDGWFHTGDVGEITPEGYVRITDRKKDLIKTAGGKYVAPQRIEGLLKLNRFVSQVHVHGDQRKYVVVLVTLNMDAVTRYASEQNVSYKDSASLCQHPKVRELVRQAIAEANTHLASYESIKNFAILPDDFTVESGELTPSLKVKRKVVDSRHGELIERLYGVDKAGL